MIYAQIFTHSPTYLPFDFAALSIATTGQDLFVL